MARIICDAADFMGTSIPAKYKDGNLNVPLIMERFIRTQEYIRDLRNEEAERRFIEDEGREKFLTYLSPIINDKTKKTGVEEVRIGEKTICEGIV